MGIRIAAPLAAAVLLSAPLARAEQFVLTDVTYTHSTETTNDSHYYPELPDDTPADWTEPVDYANGSVHIVLDVMTKPAGGAPTKLQVCFEGTPSYACTLQSPTYTTTGRVEWDSPFADFWYESTVDWSQGVNKMPLILKDDMNNKPHGNPSYMPTDLHVQVTLVSAGATFMPPPTAGSGGEGGAGGEAGASGEGDVGGGSGTGGSGGRAGAAGGAMSGRSAGGNGGLSGGSAGMPSAGSPAGAGAGGAQDTAGPSGSNAAGAGGVGAAASGGTGASAGSSGGANGGEGSGCRAVGSAQGSAPWLLVAACAYLASRRRAPSLRRSQSPRSAPTLS